VAAPPEIEIARPPCFEVGDKVRRQAIRNDGAYPGRRIGEPLIDAGEIGYITGIGEFLNRYWIYSVDFFVQARIVGEFVALKSKTSWLDINQERHHGYAGYDGMITLVRQIDAELHHPIWAQVRNPAPWDSKAEQAPHPNPLPAGEGDPMRRQAPDLVASGAKTNLRRS
jgi:hypothetical protein